MGIHAISEVCIDGVDVAVVGVGVYRGGIIAGGCREAGGEGFVAVKGARTGLWLHVIGKIRRGQTGEGLIDCAPGVMDLQQVVVEARDIAQTAEIGGRSIGLAEVSDCCLWSGINTDTIPQWRAMTIINGANTIPGDDGIAIHIEKWAEIYLFQQELEVGVVEDKWLECHD